MFQVRAAFHDTNNLRSSGHQPKCRHRSRAFYHPYTSLNTFAHRSKCKLPCPPYCFPTIHLHIFAHQARNKRQPHLFYFPASHPCTNFHRSTDNFRFHAFFRKHSRLHIYSCQSRFLRPCHVANHLSTRLHTSRHLHVCRLQVHWLYHSPKIHHKYLHLHG